MHLAEFPSGPNKRRDERRFKRKKRRARDGSSLGPSRLLSLRSRRRTATFGTPLHRGLTVPRRPKVPKVVKYSAGVLLCPFPPCPSREEDTSPNNIYVSHEEGCETKTGGTTNLRVGLFIHCFTVPRDCPPQNVVSVYAMSAAFCFLLY